MRGLNGNGNKSIKDMANERGMRHHMAILYHSKLLKISIKIHSKVTIKKEKGLMDMDNSLVTARGEEVLGVNDNGKDTI